MEEKTTLGCYMIVKDEENSISTCLESIIGVCDEIVVVDTGCSDKTMEIVKSYGEKIKTHEFKWIDDFSAARNFAMEQITTDYSFTIDADEVLSPPLQDIIKKLKNENFNGKDSYDIWLLNENGEGNPTYYIGGRQIVRHSPENIWKYKVHEKLYFKRENFGMIPFDEGHIIHSHGKNTAASNYNKYAEFYFRDLYSDNILKADNGAHYFYYLFMTLKELDLPDAKFYLSQAYNSKRIHSYTEDQRPNLYVGNYISAEELFAMNLSVTSKDYALMEEMSLAINEDLAKYILLRTVYDNNPHLLTKNGWITLSFLTYSFGKVNDFITMTEKSSLHLKDDEKLTQNQMFSVQLTDFQDKHPIIIDCRGGHDALSSNFFYFLNIFKKIYVLGIDEEVENQYGLRRYKPILIDSPEKCKENAYIIDGNTQIDAKTAISEFNKALWGTETTILKKNGVF